MNRRNFLKSSGLLGLATIVTPSGILQYKRLGSLGVQPSLNWGSEKPHTWWHWMNGNVTKAGITLDLEAMARVGIGGFQNFDAGTGIPKGPVVYLSSEWLELKKHAISEANRLGLEFTMHNCPGWSSSGGPWITPELSMQEVTWSELVVGGGKAIQVKLPKPLTRMKTYKDIAVLACRAQPGERPLKNSIKKISSNAGDITVEAVTGESGVPIKISNGSGGTNGFIEFEFTTPAEVQQISFITAAYGDNKGPVLLRASDDGKSFRDVATLSTGSGFNEPRGEVLLTSNVPVVKAKFLRLECNHQREFSQIRFSGVTRPDDWDKRGNFAFNRNGVGDISADIPAIPLTDIVDITSSMQADGSLNWTAPQGEWTIIRFGYTPIGTYNRSAPDTGVGLECDKYSAEAFEFHFTKMMDNLLPFLKPMGEKGKAGLLIDSYEVGMQNWTPLFEQSFETRNGYSIRQYLPALTGRVVGDADTTDRFLWDLRRTQGDLMADNYYGKFTELCHKNNIISYIQPYDRGPMEEMQIGSRIDINVGEFWNNLSSIFQNNWTMRRTVKLSAAIAHTNGQKVVAAESFTGEPESSRWQEHPFALKMPGDRMFTQGLNRMVFHRFAHQPHPTAKPGMTMGPWGSHFDRTNTWWEQGKVWMDYLSRCQFLLQSGTFVADLVYYTGEDAGTYTRVERSELRPAPPSGYDYDLINSEVLLKAAVDNGALVLPSGTRYRILVLQDFHTMSLNVLRKVKEFVEKGLTVMGEEPVRTPGLARRDDKEFSALVTALWSGGSVISGESLEEELARLNIEKDFSFTSRSGDAPMNFIHRRTEEHEIYFIANERRTVEEVVCSFRVSGQQPEIWDPVSGLQIPTRIFENSSGRTTLPLTINPAGSLFIVFIRNVPVSKIASVFFEDEEILQTRPFEVARESYPEIVNNFTISLWAKPETNVMLSTANFMDGQVPWTDFYAVYPVPGENLYGPGHSVAGLAIGRNGLAVWENTSGKPSFWFAAPISLSGWSHVTLRVTKGIPAVFVNGELVKEGPQSKNTIHPGGGHAFLEEGASFFNGDMQQPMILKESLTQDAIRKLASEITRSPAMPRVVNAGEQLLFFESGTYTIRNAGGKTAEILVENEPAQDLSSAWKVQFPQGSGAPASITLAKLESMHKNTDSGVKYFSGTCTYQKTFNLSQKINTKRYYLDLGEVEVIAEVFINKKSLGIFWTRPFLIDMTEAVQQGENAVEIKVTSLWPNRLIGDEQVKDPYKYSPGGGGSGFASLSGGAIVELPAWYQQGKPKPNDGRVAFTTWKHYQKDSPLLQSGLVGPVLLKTASVHIIQ
jgi:hypothetical protein